MQNNLQNAEFWFLVYKKAENRFIGICRETGYVEEGKSSQEVLERLNNGTKAIFEAVKTNESLLPSINQHPPIKYRLLFIWIPFWYSIKNFMSAIPEEIELTRRNINDFNKDPRAYSV